MPISPSYSSSCFVGLQPSQKGVISLEMAKGFIKYSYPGLRPFENSVL